MIVESVAIIVLIFLIFILFLRDRRYEYARTSAILAILPGSYLVGYFISYLCRRFFDADRMTILLIAVSIGLAATCVLIGVMAVHIRKRQLRLAYVLTTGGFAVIVGTVMLVDTVQGVFH